MKTQMEDVRKSADITPNWNDIRNTLDITELSEMPDASKYSKRWKKWKIGK